MVSREERREGLIAAGMATLKKVARECGTGETVLARQIAAGAWGKVPIRVVKWGNIVFRCIPEQSAHKITAFHQENSNLPRIVQQVRKHRDSVSRVIKILSEFPEDHPLIKKIGRVRVVEKARYAYVPNPDVQRIESFFETMVPVKKAAQQLGMYHSLLVRQIKAGYWPEAVFLPVSRHNLIHNSFIEAARTFFQTHYTSTEARKKAGVDRRVLEVWLKRGFPARRFGRNLIYYPAEGFYELVEAFKKGRKAAAEALRQWHELRKTKTVYDAKKLQELGITQEKAVALALDLFNRICGSESEQAIVKRGIRLLSKRIGAGNAVSAREAYLTLLNQMGGASTAFANNLHAFLRLGLSPIATTNILTTLNSATAEDRNAFLERVMEIAKARRQLLEQTEGVLDLLGEVRAERLRKQVEELKPIIDTEIEWHKPERQKKGD